MKEKREYDNKATVTGISDGNCRELLTTLKNLVYALNVEMGRSVIQVCIDLAKNAIKKAEGK